MRIDKLLANLAYGSRKEVHLLLKHKSVTVNDKVITKKDYAVDIDQDIVKVNGSTVDTNITYYLKYNKPSGLITAVEDETVATIMDTLPERFKKLGVAPVGRLDKDTEGLLFLTNDGRWAHRVINGKKEIPKTYCAEYEGVLSAEGKDRIAKGMVLGDGTICKPAIVSILNEEIRSNGTNGGTCLLTLTEGKFHQVKRMLGAAGGNVVALSRLSIGPVTLSDIEKSGEYQPMTPEEISFF